MNRFALIVAGGLVCTACGSPPAHQSTAAALSSSTRSHEASHVTIPHSSTPPTTPVLNSGPFRPAPVFITTINATKQHILGLPVLATARHGASLTVRATLSFTNRPPARVADAALVVARAGTFDVDEWRPTDARDRRSEVAHGRYYNAATPQMRTLSVTTSRSLRPGKYPVLWEYRTLVPIGQTTAQYDIAQTSALFGFIVITP